MDSKWRLSTLAEVQAEERKEEEQEAMDYAWGEACSQPEPIDKYEDRRGE